MTKDNQNTKQSRQRSPRYPFISLGKAIERARTMQEHENRNDVSKEALAAHWGYKVKSSGLVMTIGALRQYGLLEGRKTMKLTDLALDILFGTDGSREESIKNAAKNPEINTEILSRFESLPSDVNLRNFLIKDYQFKNNAADEYVKTFKETVSFAKLDFGDIIEDESEENNNSPIQNIMTNATVKPQQQSKTQTPPQQTSFALSTGTAYFIVPSDMTNEDKDLLKDYLKVWEKSLDLKK